MSTHDCDCTGHTPDQCSPHCHPPKKIPRTLKFRWEVFKTKWKLRAHKVRVDRVPWQCIACNTEVTGPARQHQCKLEPKWN